MCVMQDFNVALCLFGQMRSYERCYKFLEENILSELDPDIYIHTWRERGGSWKKDQDIDSGSKSESIITESKLREKYDPEEVVIEEFEQENYREIDGVRVPEKIWKFSDYRKGTLPMFYKMHAVNELKREREEEEGFKYDLVILVRPDMLIMDSIPENVIEHPNVLWHLGAGYYRIADNFTISSSENIDYMTAIWGELEDYWDSELSEYGEMGNPEGFEEGDHVNVGIPERLLHYHFKQHKVDDMSHEVRNTVLRYEDNVLTYRNLNPAIKVPLYLYQEGPKELLHRAKMWLGKKFA